MTQKQFMYLFKRELQSARRTRGIMLSLIVLPVIIWGFQLVLPLMRAGLVGNLETGDDPEIIFLVNADLASNGANPIATIPNNKSYILPFAFGGSPAGANISNLNLAEFFITNLLVAHTTGRLLEDYLLTTTVPRATVETMGRNGEINYWIEIPVEFATNYTNTGATTLVLHSLLPLDGTNSVQTAISSLIAEEPFTYPEDGIQTTAVFKQIEVETTNEGETDPIALIMDVGAPTIMAIMLTFISVGAFVSTSIATERDKKTMESLLSMPISRKKLLLGKFLAGAALSTIGVGTNIIGFMAYEFVMSDILAPANRWSNYAFNLEITALPALTLTLFLCTLVNLGIGISLSAIAKDAGTSRSIFMVLMMPVMFLIPVILFTGLPEVLAKTANAPLALSLYIIPWTHVFAIFQKLLAPTYYTTNGLFGNVWVDIGFHITVLFITVAVVMWIASKVFEREGLVN
ncbi:MAG: ABC transporter permease [Candidatus Hodarchaeota archaeon]